MKRIILMAVIFTACNDSNEPTKTTDELKDDQNASTDTRTVDPADTSKNIDTGSYDKMSDTLRKE